MAVAMETVSELAISPIGASPRGRKSPLWMYHKIGAAMSTSVEKPQSAMERRFHRENIIQIHRAGIMFLVVWALLSAVCLAILASRVPATIPELKYNASQTQVEREQTIAEWSSPLDAFNPLVRREEPYLWDDETEEDRVEKLNEMASDVIIDFRENSQLLWLLHAIALVFAVFAWRRPGIGFGLGILLIGFAGYPDFAWWFIRQYNGQLLPWILPVFLPGIMCLFTGVCGGLFHQNEKQASDWQWFWGGFAMTGLGVAAVAYAFMGSGRRRGKGAIALPIGVYLMAKHGWRLLKRRFGGTESTDAHGEQIQLLHGEANVAGTAASHSTPDESDSRGADPAYAMSFFWGMFTSLTVVAGGYFISRGLSSEDDGWRVAELMAAPLVAALVSLLISRWLVRKGKPRFLQAVPVGLLAIGLIAPFLLK